MVISTESLGTNFKRFCVVVFGIAGLHAADADLAVCAAKNRFFLYKQGHKIATVPENKIVPALLKELQKIRPRIKHGAG